MSSKSRQTRLFEALLAKSQESWSAGEYGAGLPEQLPGYFWMTSDGPNPPSGELAIDTAGNIWIMVKKD